MNPTVAELVVAAEQMLARLCTSEDVEHDMEMTEQVWQFSAAVEKAKAKGTGHCDTCRWWQRLRRSRWDPLRERVSARDSSSVPA